MGLISDGTTIFDAGALAAGNAGSLTFIKKLTASSSATLTFVGGASSVVLDGTIKEYLFTFNNLHAATRSNFLFQGRDGGTNYDGPIVSTHFGLKHNEGNNTFSLGYENDRDQANTTNFQILSNTSHTDNSDGLSGYLRIFNPAGTTYVTHFMSEVSCVTNTPTVCNNFCAGYFNTAVAINAFQFKFASAEIDSGDICLYGVA